MTDDHSARYTPTEFHQLCSFDPSVLLAVDLVRSKERQRVCLQVMPRSILLI